MEKLHNNLNVLPRSMLLEDFTWFCWTPSVKEVSAEWRPELRLEHTHTHFFSISFQQYGVTAYNKE